MSKKKNKSRKRKMLSKETSQRKSAWKIPNPKICWSFFLIPLSFFYIELFASFFLSSKEETAWILQFGVLWTVVISGLLRVLPAKLARIAYGIGYFLCAIYAGFQTGYYNLFSQMMWLSDFRYASEGADYADVLFSYPLGWWLGIFAMIAIGILILWKFPKWERRWVREALCLILVLLSANQARLLPHTLFAGDESVQYAESDYGRSKSVKAAYENMFNAHRLYRICGLYHTLLKDVETHFIRPLTPSYAAEQHAAQEEIDGFFDSHPISEDNAMTGILADKNIVLVLMESMDDWMLGEHTPTLNQLMDEGIDFTNFYTPVYGGIRTFNTEFCINTGSYLSSQGGYAFDYVTNHFNQSLPSVLSQQGYTAKTFHYNDASFYSRGEFTPAMGYSEYICYANYLDWSAEETKNLLYDDQVLFDTDSLSDIFFREGKTLNFLITRSAHLSYKYNEVLSYWGLKKYPEYKGLTGNEETDCAYLKARLVDDLFARLLAELEARGELDNTVIIGVTDHYTYGYKNMDALYELSGTREDLLLERTPCFIWSTALEAQKVSKVLNTADLMPTVLNLLGVESEYRYIGRDAFDDTYDGFVPFSNGSWILGDTAYDAGKDKYLSVSGKSQTVSAETRAAMDSRVEEFVRINNLILQTDYYK